MMRRVFEPFLLLTGLSLSLSGCDSKVPEPQNSPQEETSLGPEVEVEITKQAFASGLRIGTAQAASNKKDNRELLVQLKADKTYLGGISLKARRGKETLSQAFIRDSKVHPVRPMTATFQFGQGLDKADNYELDVAAGRDLQRHPQLADAGITLSQLRETTGAGGHEISLHATFEKPFKKTLQLQALNVSGKELGRSVSAASAPKEAGWTGFVAFRLKKSVPLDEVAKYSVSVAAAK